jgi:virulence-associated protein VapD
VMFSLQLVF